MNDFGNFLYNLRKQRGWTQTELADKLGVTNQAVSKWENGDSFPDTGMLVPLAELFGVSVDELLKGKRKPVPAIEQKTFEKDTTNAVAEKTGRIRKKTFSRKRFRAKSLKGRPRRKKRNKNRRKCGKSKKRRREHCPAPPQKTRRSFQRRDHAFRHDCVFSARRVGKLLARVLAGIFRRDNAVRAFKRDRRIYDEKENSGVLRLHYARMRGRIFVSRLTIFPLAPRVDRFPHRPAFLCAVRRNRQYKERKQPIVRVN